MVELSTSRGNAQYNEIHRFCRGFWFKLDAELPTYSKIYNISVYNSKENGIIVLCVVALHGGVCAREGGGGA